MATRRQSFSIGGMTQHVAQRCTIGAIPADIAFARTISKSVGQLQVVVDEISQNASDRAPSLEKGKNVPDRVLNAFIRIERNFA